MKRSTIEELVKQALESGYLSLEAEETLRVMLSQQYSDQALEAFWRLQQATMSGRVRQQSREKMATLTH